MRLQRNNRSTTTKLRQGNLGALAAFLGISFGAAAVGSSITLRSLNSWYCTLRKPSWNPPDWVFGPVWTVLYLQMAVSAWLVRRAVRKHPSRAPLARAALLAWAAQLTLNVGWSATFFGLRRIWLAGWTIGALWAAIAATAALSARVTPIAGLLLLPYLAWTTFASVLNLRIWQLNRQGR